MKNPGKLIIQFEQNIGFLHPDHELSIADLGLQDTIQKFRKNAYWELRIIDFEPENGKLFVDISDYKIGIPEVPEIQVKNRDKLIRIKKISFRQIDTGGLLKTVTLKFSGNTKNGNSAISKENNIPTSIKIEEKIIEPIAPAIRVLQGSFTLPIKDLRFVMGGISCIKQIKGFSDPIDFFVYNPEIREEFDAVKNYFSNFLKTKKINIQYWVKISENKLIETKAKSSEIEKINKESIESVKFEFIQKSFTKRIIGIEDKSLFTMEESFDALSNQSVKSNTFYQDADDLLNDLLKITQTKHYKNLRYLSSLHAHSIMKLRFVLKPLSFVFLVPGERYYYLVWETLDTAEATYIWRSERNKDALKTCLSKVEDILNIIKVQGKIAYINTGDDSLKRIYHDYSDLKEGFIRWKGELDSCLR